MRVKPDGRDWGTILGSGAGGSSGISGAGLGTGYFGTSFLGFRIVFGSDFGCYGVSAGYLGFSASYPSVISVLFYLGGEDWGVGSDLGALGSGFGDSFGFGGVVLGIGSGGVGSIGWDGYFGLTGVGAGSSFGFGVGLDWEDVGN